MDQDVFVFPSSFAQRRMWFLNQLEPGSPVYNMAEAIRILGPLRTTVLEQCLNEIVRRHEALRTTFSMFDGQPVQLIAPSLHLRLRIVELQDIPESERLAAVRRLAAEEGQYPFDLEAGPLLRTTLLRLDHKEHYLLLAMHHIIFDGWSLGILFREISALYPTYSNGEPSPLPELTIQYADYAVWQQRWLHGEALQAQVDYWRIQLAGAAPNLKLPADRALPADRNQRGARQSLILPKSLSEALKHLGQQHSATLFMTMLAGFKILLYRYTGQADIIVGSPIAGRNRSEIEELIGFFVNTLVLRTKLAGSLTFKALLAQVRQTTLAAFAHQDVPFEKLVEELQPDRILQQTPLFNIMVNFVSTPQRTLDIPELEAYRLRLAADESKFLMTLYIIEEDPGLTLQVVYRQAFFSDELVTCMLDQFRHVLEQISAAPDEPIRTYSLVTPATQTVLPDPTALLVEPPYRPIDKLFTFWAERLPEQTAICQGERHWTYHELATRTDGLTRSLLAAGLKPGDVVAVRGQRSFGLIAGMLAVFVSGGVLLAIDPAIPVERQRVMLAEAGATYLLNVSQDQPRQLQAWDASSLRSIRVDPDTGQAAKIEVGADPAKLRLPELSANDPAYVFYTSGTTGMPKGILGCHKGLSHFLTWQRQTFKIGPADRSAQLTGLSFDVMLRDIFLPLTSGATLVLPADPAALAPDQVISWLNEQRISILHAVPALAQAWLDGAAPAGASPTLRLVFFAGEPLTDTLIRGWRRQFSESCDIVNLYGPTETTMAKCYFRVPSAGLLTVQPIGWPLPETQVLILTEGDRLGGIAEPGEIVIRTPFRTLGYINDPPEIKRRFVRNPFRDDPQDVVYRTGDRGRYRVDGSVEYLGRLDHQVKIRGIRVEPAEIRAVVCQYPGIKSCEVVARRNEQGQPVLVAYVVALNEQRLSVRKIRHYLGSQLPASYVPSGIVQLEQLPLTENGKVDYSALPAPSREQSQLEISYVAPRNPVEVVITGVWADILDVEQVGVHDSFFELGGHSLLATQVISRLNNVLQTRLPLRSLFENPTVAGLAETLFKSPGERLRVEETARIVLSLVSLSDDEARILLENKDTLTEEDQAL